VLKGGKENYKSKLEKLSNMKNFIFITLLSTILFSCNEKVEKVYLEGDPIIVKKEVSMIPGYCIYHYEGWSRREYFEDKCDKYSIGDKIIKN
jgi:hypothetical protein